MENQDFELQWVERIDNSSVNQSTHRELISIDTNTGESISIPLQEQFMVQDISANTLDQIAAENLIYMAQDGQMEMVHRLIDVQGNEVEHIEQLGHAEEVTEEVITDDWVQQQGVERVEIPVDQICGQTGAEDIDVPLPTVQDQYTALRPYPCDFCSRRFRKKNSLMNHMVAHQNDRPHICKLCGSRYTRRSELLNHLKSHAQMPDPDQCDDVLPLSDHVLDAATFDGDHYYDADFSCSTVKAKKKTSSAARTKKSKVTLEENITIVETPVDKDDSIRYPVLDDNKPFVCQQCGIAFARDKALLSHTRIHEKDSPLECKECNDVFWDIATLEEHQKTHQFEASNSEYEPENENDTDTDGESKYGEFYCHECGMSFHRQDLLKRHAKCHIKKESVDRESRLCCNNCGETFAEALDLLAHAEIHARYPSFKCVLCGETFFEETTIKKHLTNMHASEMTENSCILCGKECRDSKALIKHSWDHSREKCHSCSKCGKSFHNKARLKRHMASHRDKSVVCDVCHAEFPDGRSLSNHRHSHSSASGKQFPCHECGKTFGSRSSQQIHVRIHTGERPYGCRFCWKAFADGGTLRKHERIHTGEKPYACSVCPRAFNQRVVLREHIRSHHSGMDIKRGTYFCPVCGDDLPSSVDLIQHLIHHSDLNTAMQRQPVTGPRKYKRRRKLKPHEIERLRFEKSSNGSDLDYSDFDMASVDNILDLPNNNSETKTPKNDSQQNNVSCSSRSPKVRTISSGSDKYEKLSNGWQTKLIHNSNDDAYKSLLSNPENTLQSIDTLVVGNSPPIVSVDTPSTNPVQPLARKKKRCGKNDQYSKTSRRPKMIHTQKTRVNTESGKRKSKSMITRTEPADIQVFNTYRKNTPSNDYDVIVPDPIPPSKIVPSPIRIKNEPTCRSDLYDAQLLLEATSMRKEFDKYNPAIVNDLEEILRSPESNRSPARDRRISERIDETIKIELESPKLQYEDDSRRSARSRRSVPNRKYLEFETTLPSFRQRVKTEKKTAEDIEYVHSISISSSIDMVSTETSPKKMPVFECEMCSAKFNDRAQLLAHVPIHI